MENRIAVISERSYRFEGFFDIKSTYKNVMEYIENVLNYDLVEKEHNESNDGKKKNIVQSFEAEKHYNETFKIVQKIKLSVNGSDVQIEVNGRQVTSTKGKAELAINVYLEPNWNMKPKDTPFWKFMKICYYKFVGQNEQQAASNLAVEDTNNIIRRFKTYANATIK